MRCEKKRDIFIIAEAGVNHNGSLDLALQMIREAKKAGADAIKFQTFRTDELLSKFAPKAEYQKKQTGNAENQKEMLSRLELSFEEFRSLKKAADQEGILFLSTPFDLASIDFLDSLGMPFWKIPSGEVTDLPYLEKIAKTEKRILMSTGMCEMEEIGQALQVFYRYGYTQDQITLLHCTTEYPAPVSEVNLAAMETLRKEFGVEVGYSDHTEGIAVSIAAAAMGARVLEKHFTLDRSLSGPDHKASLVPEELKELTDSVRAAVQAVGSGEKYPTEAERRNRIAARKSLVARERIRAGEILTEENVTVKRPGDGLSPMRWYEVLGKKAKRDFEEDELIEI